jgi:hypothetical protein
VSEGALLLSNAGVGQPKLADVSMKVFRDEVSLIELFIEVMFGQLFFGVLAIARVVNSDSLDRKHVILGHLIRRNCK